MSALRTAKKTFLQYLSSLVRTPRKFWSAYYSLRPNRQRIPVHLSNGPVTAESVQNKCDLLNSFFASTFSHCLPVSPQTIAAQSLPALESISCSSEDVRKLLTSMSSKTATGHDGISSQMLKISASSVHPNSLLYLISSCLLALSLLIGNYPTSLPSTKPVTPVLCPTTILFLFYLFHPRVLNALSTINYWTTSYQTPCCPTPSLVSDHRAPPRRPSSLLLLTGTSF